MFCNAYRNSLSIREKLHVDCHICALTIKLDSGDSLVLLSIKYESKERKLEWFCPEIQLQVLFIAHKSLFLAEGHLAEQ